MGENLSFAPMFSTIGHHGYERKHGVEKRIAP